MKNFSFGAIAALFACVSLHANENSNVPQVLDSGFVYASRATERTPITFSRIGADELKSMPPATSLPQNLSLQPSVVAVSECGTGVGYTSLSIRGVSPYHTNVTLNGISLADCESQQVFWANIPALNSFLSSVELTRGLGAAVCGPGAFGAAINMLTDAPSKVGGSVSGSYGSFNTTAAQARGYSGVLKNGFFADAAFNYEYTDGYIRNAPANVLSAYANLGWKGKRDVVQAVFVQGWQKTAITWNGVPFDKWETDPQYNVNEGDTDNFTQTHIQLDYKHDFTSELSWKNTFNYTHGSGWYDISGFKDYLKNNLYVLRSDLQWHRPKFMLGGILYLSGFGAEHYNGGAYEPEDLYRDFAVKNEIDLSVRGEWSPLKVLALFAEVQYRGVYYSLYDTPHRWNFCNPRAGVSYSPNGNNKLYFSFAMGGREPARSDFNSNPDVRQETMFDYELGYKYASPLVSASLNGYYMDYVNMLLESGMLDSQGYAIRYNVDRAFRAGIEAVLNVKPLKWFAFEANCTWSMNKIVSAGAASALQDGNPLLLSPSWVAAGVLKFTPWKFFTASWSTKYVSDQYYDNSGQSSSIVPWYIVSDLSAGVRCHSRCCDVVLSAVLGNVFGRKYYAYACAWGVYPAAPRTINVKLAFEF